MFYRKRNSTQCQQRKRTHILFFNPYHFIYLYLPITVKFTLNEYYKEQCLTKCRIFLKIVTKPEKFSVQLLYFAVKRTCITKYAMS